MAHIFYHLSWISSTGNRKSYYRTRMWGHTQDTCHSNSHNHHNWLDNPNTHLFHHWNTQNHSLSSRNTYWLSSSSFDQGMDKCMSCLKPTKWKYPGKLSKHHLCYICHKTCHYRACRHFHRYWHCSKGKRSNQHMSYSWHWNIKCSGHTNTSLVKILLQLGRKLAHTQYSLLWNLDRCYSYGGMASTHLSYRCKCPVDIRIYLHKRHPFTKDKWQDIRTFPLSLEESDWNFHVDTRGICLWSFRISCNCLGMEDTPQLPWCQS